MYPSDATFKSQLAHPVIPASCEQLLSSPRLMLKCSPSLLLIGQLNFSVKVVDVLFELRYQQHTYFELEK